MRKLMFGSAGLVLSMGIVSGTHAQTAANEETRLEEIIVTAEKREMDLQKVATSIQVYKGDDLKKQGKQRIDEIMNGVIGVTTQTDRGGSMIFYFRGQNTGLGAGPGVSNPGGVALVIDGITQDRSDTLRGGTVDVAQVEVMRGTQNTTVGGGAISGAISLVSNAPVLGAYSASGSVEMGSYNRQNTQGVLNIPVGATQALRMAFSTTRQDGYASSNAGESDLRNVRVRYRWQPTSSLDMTFTYNNQKIGGNGVSDGAIAYTGHYVPYSGQAVYSPATGLSYNPSQMFNNAGVTYTFAAGSVLGPGQSPTTAATTVTYSQPCGAATTPSLFSTANNTTPFISYTGCPANMILVRDNVNYWQRSNPWDDGFRKVWWQNSPFQETNINNFSADIQWDTSIGTWSFLPGIQHTVGRTEEALSGMGYNRDDRNQDSWQLEARLSSPRDSKVTWQQGLYYHYTSGFEGYQAGVSLPTTAILPTIGASGTTQTSPPGAYPTLLTSCYVFNGTYCTTLNNLNEANWKLEASLFGNLTWPVLDQFRVLGGYRYTKQKSKTDNTVNTNHLISPTLDLATLGGYVFTGAPGTNCNTGTCTVTYTTSSIESHHRSVINSDWNGNWTIYDAATGITTTQKTRGAEFQYRIGLEYDVTPDAMVYGVYNTASQPSSPGGPPTFAVGLPLELKQFTLGAKTQWLNDRLQANIEAWDSKIGNRTASSVIGSNYTLTSTTVGVTCPTLTTAAATAVLSPVNPDGSPGPNSCFNMPLTAANTANVVSRGADLEITFLPTSMDRVNLTVEYLPKSQLTGINGISPITAADVQAAAAANTSNPSSGTPAQQLAAAQAIAANFNGQLANVTGGILQQSPKWSIDTSYAHSFLLPGGSRITPRVNYVYKSAYWIAAGPNGNTAAAITNSTIAINNGLFWGNVQPSYHLWNAYTSLESADGKWSINGYITNIQNTPVMVSGGPTTTASSTPGNVVVTGGSVGLGAPRVIGVSISANF